MRRHIAAAAITLTITAPVGAVSLSVDDVDALGRIVYAEAGTQPVAGKAAVLGVVLNRAASGQGVQAVIDAPGQFEPVSRAAGRSWRGLRQLTAPELVEFRAIIELAVGGHLLDPSGGALFFQNPTIVAARERAGTVSKGLTGFRGMPVTTSIGDHTFYRPASVAGRARAVEASIAKEKGAGETVFTDAGETDFGVAPTR